MHRTPRGRVMRRAAGYVLVLLWILLLSPSAVLAQAPNDDRLILGDEYVLPSGETLAGHLTILGGSARLEPDSRVKSDVVLFGGELYIAGTIQGALTVFGGSVTLADTATIEGDFAAFGGAVEQGTGAIVKGDVYGRPRSPIRLPMVPAVRADTASPSSLAALLRWQLGTFAVGLLVALLAAILVLVLPRQMSAVSAVVAHQPAYSFGLGLLTLGLGLLAGALLLIACGLGLLVWLALLAGVLMGWSAVGVLLGERVCRSLRLTTPSPVVAALVGGFLLTVPARLPVSIGFLFGIIVASIGLGAVVVTRFGTQHSTDHRSPNDGNSSRSA